MNPLYVGECQVCFQGRLIVRKAIQGGRLFVQCEECECTPESEGGVAARPSVAASALDLENHPLRDRIVNTADLDER